MIKLKMKSKVKREVRGTTKIASCCAPPPARTKKTMHPIKKHSSGVKKIDF